MEEVPAFQSYLEGGCNGHFDIRSDLVVLDEATAEAFDDSAMEADPGNDHEVQDLHRSIGERDASKDLRVHALEEGPDAFHEEDNVHHDHGASERTEGSNSLDQRTRTAG